MLAEHPCWVREVNTGRVNLLTGDLTATPNGEFFADEDRKSQVSLARYWFNESRWSTARGRAMVLLLGRGEQEGLAERAKWLADWFTRLRLRAFDVTYCATDYEALLSVPAFQKCVSEAADSQGVDLSQNIEVLADIALSLAIPSIRGLKRVRVNLPVTPLYELYVGNAIHAVEPLCAEGTGSLVLRLTLERLDLDLFRECLIALKSGLSDPTKVRISLEPGPARSCTVLPRVRSSATSTQLASAWPAMWNAIRELGFIHDTEWFKGPCFACGGNNVVIDNFGGLHKCPEMAASAEPVAFLGALSQAETSIRLMEATERHHVQSQCYECSYLGLCRGGFCPTDGVWPGCSRVIYEAAITTIVNEVLLNQGADQDLPLGGQSYVSG